MERTREAAEIVAAMTKLLKGVFSSRNTRCSDPGTVCHHPLDGRSSVEIHARFSIVHRLPADPFLYLPRCLTPPVAPREQRRTYPSSVKLKIFPADVFVSWSCVVVFLFFVSCLCRFCFFFSPG